jgi:hypothetical protein
MFQMFMKLTPGGWPPLRLLKDTWKLGPHQSQESASENCVETSENFYTGS